MKTKDEEAHGMRFLCMMLVMKEYRGVDAESSCMTVKANKDAGKGIYRCILTNN